MNILFVHEIDWLRKVVFEIHTLSELLSLNKHRVYAIDYESMWIKDNLFDFGTLRTKTINNLSRAYPGASVSLIRPGFIKIPGLSRLTAAFTHYSEIRRTIIDKKIDAVILYSVPTNGLQTIRLVKKLGIPVIFRSIDILNQLAPSPILAFVTRLLEKKVYSNVDLILTISPKLSEYVIGIGAREEKVKLLPLGIDTNQFKPGIDTTELCRKWGLSNEATVIVFIGTLFDFSGLDDFIRRFSGIIKQIPEVKLLIVGDGPQRPSLERIISELNLRERVLITGFQPYETMPQYINMATLCINPFRITDITRDIFPTKILQYLACGRPVIATPLPGMTALAPGENQGIVYTDNLDEMASSTVSLIKSPERRNRLGRAAMNYVKQTHSYDRIVAQLEATLIEITREG